MNQTGLIDQIIEDFSLNKKLNQHKTTITRDLLQEHNDAKLFSESWEYRSIVGKLVYLSKNTQPNIEYALH